MRPLAVVSMLSALAVLLSGCGEKLPRLSATQPSTTQQSIEPPAPRVKGDWEFSATSNAAGSTPLRFAGSIDSQTDPNQGSTDFKGVLHLDGSKCFDRVMAAGFTGTATADKGSATITTSDGQVVTLTGVFAAQSPTGVYTNMIFTGTYSISGGCASGDQGDVTGININPSFSYPWWGSFMSSGGASFDLSTPEGSDGLNMTPSASLNGVFGITGDIATHSPCFTKGTLSSGAFPSGSFILGRSVVLEGHASDSVLRIEGNLC